MGIGINRTLCGYHHSILMGNRPPPNQTGRMRMLTLTRHNRPHTSLLPMGVGQGCAGPRATQTRAVVSRMCACKRWIRPAPCGLWCAGALGLCSSHPQAAAGLWRSALPFTAAALFFHLFGVTSGPLHLCEHPGLVRSALHPVVAACMHMPRSCALGNGGTCAYRSKL